MTGALAGLDPCVHCGFCLQTCPTYVATGDEADGPRGRILLMRQLSRGELDGQDEHLMLHLDRCLGCRACETACPSGVVFGPALEHVRAEFAGHRGIPPIARVVLGIMAEPRYRRPLLGIARLLRPLARLVTGKSMLGFLAGMIAATRMDVVEEWESEHVNGDVPGEGDGTPIAPSPPIENPIPAALFRGCIMEGLFAHVHAATRRTLVGNGYSVAEPAAQACCGALHAHAGLAHDARQLARANVRAFSADPEATIAVNSAGCGAMLKSYSHLLADDPLAKESAAFASRVKDVSEMLADAGPRPGLPLHLRVAYDAPCHLRHAQRIVDAPQRILGAIPGITPVPHEEADACCGSAGLYSLMQPAISRMVLERKLRAIRAASPDVVVSGNPGCVMHLGAGLMADGQTIPVIHPVELLDWSYRLDARGFY